MKRPETTEHINVHSQLLLSVAKLLEYNYHSDDEKLIQPCSQFLHFIDCFVHRYVTLL